MNIGPITGINAGTLIFLIPIVAIICGTISEVFGKNKKGANAEEAKMIQEIYNGLERMEGRIDALETIMYDQKK